MSERKRVLIISDEVDLAMLMRSYFTRKDYEVYIAHDYANGLSAAAREQPDLIFLDDELCRHVEEDRDKLQKVAPLAKISRPEDKRF